MGKPKKRTSSRRTGMRRSHLVNQLAKSVNAKSPVKVRLKKAAPTSVRSEPRTKSAGAAK